ncbi:hypothetical protein PV10_06446 [Exophiala mesophila]|uniref:Uncharacterized protein n=1 Tax=Exophiala mesophila TaxID=212818 RepID=A0A0D1WS08_EXOME|nr:uncharacterized protein PV10_06446 [Exophiala mesophila]KIV91960.1 hypothetical protein PV10_06446 [Exophiala mesophila]
MAESVTAAQSLGTDAKMALTNLFATLLTRELLSCAVDPDVDIGSLLETMPTLLRNFSADLRVEQTQSDAFFRRSTAAFVRLNRFQISRKFADSFQARMDLAIAETTRSNQDDKPTIPEKIKLPSNYDPSGESESDCALDVDNNVDSYVETHPDEARRHVEESTSFRLMVEKAKAVFKLTSSSRTTMKDVRLQVDKALRAPTGRLSSSRINIECHISWDPAQFLIDQFDNPTEASLCDVMTITSSNEEFQAATCLEYVRQVWPITGEELLLSLQDYVHNQLLQMPRSIPPLSVKLSNGTHVKIVLCKGRLFAECDGLGHAVAEVIEELAWLGAACREHSVADQLGMCFIDVQYLSSVEPHIAVTYSLKDLKPATGHATDSSCWHALFRNSVVVQGYPIKRRTQNQQGLEMPMELMLGLGLTDTVTVYNRGLVIDGLQSMFVPVGRTKDSIQWHYIHSELDECIMYSRADEVCPDRLREDRLDESALGIGRNFVGWTTKAELLFGSDKINYKNIRPSHLDRCGPGYALEKASITAGKFLMLGVTIVPGQKDKASHHDLSSSYKLMIGCAARRNVILYDAQDQLGWLTDAASALLHLSRAQLSLDILEGVELQQYRSPDPSFIGNACIKALLDNTNRTLEIDRQYIGTTEERILVNGKWETKTVVRYRTIYFEDMVKDNWKILNQIFSYSDSHTGIELPTSIRKHIEGFDFDDIVHSAQQMFPLATPLDRQRGAWLDFARKINAITLFGTGFGDLIIPAAGSNKLCDYWSLVPKSLDYLVVSVAHLERLRNAQSTSQECHSENIELGKGIYWHRGDRLFEHCDGCTTSQPCDRAQKVNARIPGREGCMGFPTDNPAGAVIFGHMAHKRLWSSKDELHARPTPQSRSHFEQTDVAFSDSGIGASIADASSFTDPRFHDSETVAVPASWGRMIHQSNSRDEQPESGRTVDHKDSQMHSQTGRLLILCKTGFRRRLSRPNR